MNRPATAAIAAACAAMARALIPAYAGAEGIHAAAERGDTATVRQMLKTDVKQLDEKSAEEGGTPLMYAARGGRTDTIRLLVAWGADVNDRDLRGRTAIVWALEGEGGEDTVRFLLQKGAKASVWTDQGTPAINIAVEKKGEKPSMVKLQLDAGADVNSRDRDGRTALHLAAQRGFLQTGRLLTQKGAKLDGKDAQGHTPLHYAAINGQTAFAQMLLQAGASKEIPGTDGLTAAQLALKKGHPDTARAISTFTAAPSRKKP